MVLSNFKFPKMVRLVVFTPAGKLFYSAPVAYQWING